MNAGAPGFEFSQDSYESLLRALNSSGYRFLAFSEVASVSPADRVCLMRHDVDISMDFAVDMARTEYSQGVRATYFLMLRSPMYNLMSRHCLAAVRELLDFGHEIALHFDAGCPSEVGISIEDDIRFELDILSGLVGSSVCAFSLHQPTEEVIRQRIAISGVINTYHPDQLAGFKYISDSNRRWREENPYQLIAADVPRVQLLIHPIWWMCEAPHTSDCWNRAIERNFISEQKQLLETERAYGAERAVRVLSLSGGAHDGWHK